VVDKRPQGEQILAYLQAGHSLTPSQALFMFGCMRLAARIKDLRDARHPITMTLHKDGYAVYSLAAPAPSPAPAQGQAKPPARQPTLFG
jgi:hypothetical protein